MVVLNRVGVGREYSLEEMLQSYTQRKVHYAANLSY